MTKLPLNPAVKPVAHPATAPLIQSSVFLMFAVTVSVAVKIPPSKAIIKTKIESINRIICPNKIINVNVNNYCIQLSYPWCNYEFRTNSLSNFKKLHRAQKKSFRFDNSMLLTSGI